MKGIIALLLLGLAVAAPVNQELQNELPGEDIKTRPHPTGLPTVSFSLPPLPTGSGFPGCELTTYDIATGNKLIESKQSLAQLVNQVAQVVSRALQAALVPRAVPNPPAALIPRVDHSLLVDLTPLVAPAALPLNRRCPLPLRRREMVQRAELSKAS
ncbi:hypothetical protein F4813DRAFT_55219 [Daldinia decipiens]|uniref:uncharacterized protein n=1 Tax=Daldinia decipiens TaxID=326647 RepID=UPI0020C238AD|nr:uncharacterized protein F4813DRAFT_55219 [Daldinia decipiens]KAI1658143.1 hypothetical protein F4813DRAFT_55219 [Daldinia decipiens]